MKAVDPAISAIRTVRRFRSPSRAARVARICVDRLAALRASRSGCKTEPQPTQIFDFGELRHVQLAHIWTSMEPQFAQNFASSSFWRWHVSQSIAVQLCKPIVYNNLQV